MKAKDSILTVLVSTLIAGSLLGNTAQASTNLADKNYQSGEQSYIYINDNKSTLNPKSWKYVHVNYSNLDHLNRTSGGNTAYLSSKNVANDSKRLPQYWKPTGFFQKKVGHYYIINRGHEIAYSLSKGISKNGSYNPSAVSGDQNNPKNLFTQTAFSNQRVQTRFETKVRDALRDGYKVIYRVQSVFKGNDLMAKGVHMQAISTNGKLNFNVYLYNVQPGFSFNYATGRSKVDHSMDVPKPDIY